MVELSRDLPRPRTSARPPFDHTTNATMSARPGTAPASPRSTLGTPRVACQGTLTLSKTFIVALDGSDQAMRGLHLAAALCSPLDRIKVVTISVGITNFPTANVDSQSVDNQLDFTKLSPEGLLARSKAELILAGVGPRSVITDMVDPGDSTIAETLVHESNVLRRGAGLLVIGSAGKGALKRKGTTGLGSVATHVLMNCKCPIALVKGPELLSRGPRGEVMGVRPSLQICVCVDGASRSHISKGAFDAALRFCSRPGDRLAVLHVQTATPAEEEKSTKYWVEEVQKAAFNSSTEVTFQSLVCEGTNDIVTTVLQKCDELHCQVVVTGSVELVKLHGSDHPLGSVAQAVASRTRAHTIIGMGRNRMW